jgi:methylisocitrate lyase
MAALPSPGARFRAALVQEKPLQIVGTINAYSARLDVLTDIRRITDVCDLPLLVDVDTGWGGAFNIARTVKSLIKFGAAAMHIEDQVQQKRCGHRPNKEIVGKDEMVDRIKAAVDAKSDPEFVVMARTDALAVEGLDAAIDRACACVEAGADMIFPEAITELSMYRKFADAVKVPILANITEFGKTPLFSTQELGSANVAMVLYPLSAWRAANAAALKVYEGIRRDGHQKNVVELMQSRDDLYDYLGYHEYEKKLDALFAQSR